jgi:hypothetical protein
VLGPGIVCDNTGWYCDGPELPLPLDSAARGRSVRHLRRQSSGLMDVISGDEEVCSLPSMMSSKLPGNSVVDRGSSSFLSPPPSLSSFLHDGLDATDFVSQVARCSLGITDCPTLNDPLKLWSIGMIRLSSPCHSSSAGDNSTPSRSS